jgi:hypothetical protein
LFPAGGAGVAVCLVGDAAGRWRGRWGMWRARWVLRSGRWMSLETACLVGTVGMVWLFLLWLAVRGR